jgi:hypothetical protein
MKIKYRVKQIGDMFYPQIRVFLFWIDISVDCCYYSYGDIRLYENPETLCCNSLEEATKALSCYIHNYLPSFTCKGYKVRTYLDRNKREYLYVAENKKAMLWDNCSEKLCEKIAEKEYERKVKEKHNKKVTIHEFNEG